MIVSAVVFEAVGELVAVFDAIDKMGFDPDVGAERRLVDESPDLRGLEMAFARGGRDQLVEQAVCQRFIFFALRRGKVVVGKDVGGALVFADRGEVRSNSQLIQ